MIELEADELETISKFRAGKEAALASYFDAHRWELQKMIRLRLDRRLARRLDDSDIIQEAYVDSCTRLESYLESPQIPPAAWIRRLARQVVARIQREHFSTQKRDVRREAYETTLFPFDLFEISDAFTPPDRKAAKFELSAMLEVFIEKLTPLEREIVVLIHVEELTIRDAAIEIGIQLEAAKKRYRRALNRLRTLTKSLDASVG